MNPTISLKKTATLLGVLLTVIYGTAAPVCGASLFSGLVLSQGEQAGAKVVEVYPNSPAGKAGIKVADLVVELNGEKVTKLDDFVTNSHKIDKKVPEVTIKVLRNGKLLNFVIASYSMPVYQLWKVKVVEPPYSTVGGVSLLQYWTEKGNGELLKNQKDMPTAQKLANCSEAVKDYFFALHYSPTSVDVGLKAADAYKTMGDLYQSEGSVPEAVRSYAVAAEFYNKCSNLTTKEQDLQKILDGLQYVEERLFMLLPEEQSDLNQRTQGSGAAKNEP